jgi:hypothetical protein
MNCWALIDESGDYRKAYSGRSIQLYLKMPNDQLVASLSRADGKKYRRTRVTIKEGWQL